MRASFTAALSLAAAVALCGDRAESAPTSPSADPSEQVTAPPPRRGPPPPRVERPTTPQTLPDGSGLGELGLTRTDDGSYIYRDPARRFTARFNRDGTVDFADRWRRPSNADSQQGTCCALPPEGLAAINPFWGVPIPDLAVLIMRAQGKDPTSHAKSELLDRTRELRTKMAIAWHLTTLQRRLNDLEPELLEVWTDHTRSPKQRRDYLFERWDECDERFETDVGDIPSDAITRIDAARRKTAEQARRRIERFIRRHASRNSALRFTPAELAAMNRRRMSRQRFDPYQERPRERDDSE